MRSIHFWMVLSVYEFHAKTDDDKNQILDATHIFYPKIDDHFWIFVIDPILNDQYQMVMDNINHSIEKKTYNNHPNIDDV